MLISRTETRQSRRRRHSEQPTKNRQLGSPSSRSFGLPKEKESCVGIRVSKKAETTTSWAWLHDNFGVVGRFPSEQLVDGTVGRRIGWWCCWGGRKFHFYHKDLLSPRPDAQKIPLICVCDWGPSWDGNLIGFTPFMEMQDSSYPTDGK